MRALRNRADLIFVDKQIGLILARQADHAIVKVFDPSGHRLPVTQQYRDGDLSRTERTQIKLLLPGFVGGHGARGTKIAKRCHRADIDGKQSSVPGLSDCKAIACPYSAIPDGAMPAM